MGEVEVDGEEETKIIIEATGEIITNGEVEIDKETIIIIIISEQIKMITGIIMKKLVIGKIHLLCKHRDI